MTSSTPPDLVVISHLRWNWVWQRPQHLVSRFAASWAAVGSRTWFVEEPVLADVDHPRIRTTVAGPVTRVWLEVPPEATASRAIGFDYRGASNYAELLMDLLDAEHSPRHPDVLVYTPMALDIARALAPSRLYYDVMDDLASFKNAPNGLRLRQVHLLEDADLVFTGGRSLHESISRLRQENVFLFPSGVDIEHYAQSRSIRNERGSGDRLVAGYVGVIDERLDLELIAGLANALPDWTIRMVGPVAKIDESSLPHAPNIEYLGMAPYSQLPEVMASFDVALMPFALNDATKSISPTKTLEYLAAGLPVISTRVADVVSDYYNLVHFAATGEDFAVACALVVEHELLERDELLAPIQQRQHWNTIAAEMGSLMAAAGASEVRHDRSLDSSFFSDELERAHHSAAGAARAGLQDAALGAGRLNGSGVAELAEAAVTSATPFLRAPLLARLSAALVLHPPGGDAAGRCRTCGTTAPCETAIALRW